MAGISRSLALMIGVQDYRNGVPPLLTPANDAREIARHLRDVLGYEVIALPSDLLDPPAGEAAKRPTRADIEGALDALKAAVDATDGGCRVLFYFAGHGIALPSDDGLDGYVIPEDATLHEIESYLAMTDLCDKLVGLGCHHLLAVLDCCFAGAFRWTQHRDLTVAPAMYKERGQRFLEHPAWQVITSASYDQQALDSLSGFGGRHEDANEQHSPFARALLDGLVGKADLASAGLEGDGVITATELYVYLRNVVEPATIDAGSTQTPGIYPLSTDDGEYIFVIKEGALELLPPAPELNPENNPFRGLYPYDASQGDLFFGRSAVVSALFERLAKEPLTVVVGPSGSGKTSVLRAGLLPRVAREQPGAWEVVEVDAGADPEGAIAQVKAALAQLSSVSAKRVLAVLDPLDEIFARAADDAVRSQFSSDLMALLDAHASDLRVVCALRTRFVPGLDASPLGQRIAAARVDLPPMTQDQLRRVIDGNTTARVLYFDQTGFVDRLINEVSATSAALPILSLTLDALYQRYGERFKASFGEQGDRALRLEDYEGFGGASGLALREARKVYDSLDAGGRDTLRRILLRAIDAAESGSVKVRAVPLAELEYGDAAEDARVRDVLGRLVGARVLVEDLVDGLNGASEPGVVLCDRALASAEAWQSARLAEARSEEIAQWIEAGAADRAWERELTRDARSWEEEGRPPEALWSKHPSLARATEVLNAGERLRFSRVEARFIRESVTAAREIASRELSNHAMAFVESEIDTSLLLAAQALDASPTYEAERALLSTLQRARCLAAQLRSRDDDSAIIGLSFSLDKSKLFVAHATALAVWDVKQHKQLHYHRILQSCRCMAASPTRDVIAVGQGKDLELYNMSDSLKPILVPKAADLFHAQSKAFAEIAQKKLVPGGAPFKLPHELSEAEPDAGGPQTNLVDGVVPFKLPSEPPKSEPPAPHAKKKKPVPGGAPFKLPHELSRSEPPQSQPLDEPRPELADTLSRFGLLDVAMRLPDLRKIERLVFSPKGNHLVVLMSDPLFFDPVFLLRDVTGSTPKFVDLTSISLAGLLPVARIGTLVDAAFSEDETLLVVATSDSIRLFDLDDQGAHEQKKIQAGGQLTRIAVHPSKKVVAAGTSEGRIVFWNIMAPPQSGAGATVAASAQDAPLLVSRVAHDGPISALHLGVRRLTSAGGGRIAGWDVQVIERSGELEVTASPPQRLGDHWGDVRAFAADNNGLFASASIATQRGRSSAQSDLRLWTAPDTHALATRLVSPAQFHMKVREWREDAVTALAFTGRGSLSASVGERISTWTLSQPKEPAKVAAVEGAAQVSSIAYEPQRGLLAIACRLDPKSVKAISAVRIRPAAARNPLSNDADISIPVEAVAAWSVTFSPDGRYLAFCMDRSPWLAVFETQGYKPVALPAPLGRSPTQVAWSPGKQHEIAVAGVDPALARWNVSEGAAGKWLLLPDDAALFRASVVAYGPQSAEEPLLALGAHEEIVLHRPNASASEREITVLAGHADSITCVAWSPDGKRLASGSLDGVVMLWDVGVEKAIGAVQLDSSAITCLAFEPGGNTLAVGNEAGRVTLWKVDAAHWQQRARAIAARELTGEERSAYVAELPALKPL